MRGVALVLAWPVAPARTSGLPFVFSFAGKASCLPPTKMAVVHRRIARSASRASSRTQIGSGLANRRVRVRTRITAAGVWANRTFQPPCRRPNRALTFRYPLCCPHRPARRQCHIMMQPSPRRPKCSTTACAAAICRRLARTCGREASHRATVVLRR
jgi:hypothetical protein